MNASPVKKRSRTPMRIAFLVEEFPCLSETFILNQITGLIDLGHEVDIYAGKQKKYSKVHPVIQQYSLLKRVVYYEVDGNSTLKTQRFLRSLLVILSKQPSTLISAYKALSHPNRYISIASLLYIKSLLKPDYDVIHCHFGLNGLKGMYLKEFNSIRGKLIVTFHGIDIADSVQNLLGDRILEAYKELFQKADLFLPISKRWQNRLIELGCNPQKIHVHHMGIDCNKFSFKPRSLNPDGTIKILTIARLVEKKGVEFGIRAVAELLKSHSNLEYNIVGDGPLKEKLQQLVQDLGVTGNVKLLGWQQQTEVIELFSEAHLLLAPSVTSQQGDQEGIPVTLMEAMAVGLPIVSTQHSGIPELVEDSVSGFLVPERDVEALTQKLLYLIENPILWAKMGQSGRAFVEKHYNIHKLNHQLVKVFQQLNDGELEKFNCI